MNFIYQNLALDMHILLNQAQICIETTKTCQVDRLEKKEEKKKKGYKNLIRNLCEMFQFVFKQMAHSPSYCSLTLQSLARPSVNLG